MVGRPLAHYCILEKLGGGRGVVYRVLDTALDREVAPKVLPDAFTHDSEPPAKLIASTESVPVLLRSEHAVQAARGVRGLLVLLVCVAWASSLGGALTSQQKSRIEQITGAKGSYTPDEDVYKVTFPRTDVKVTVDRWAMHPFLGLTSWAAFTSGHPQEAIVMGDLVLFQDEVDAVMSVALDNGLTITALHNHFLFDHPKVMFMHIAGSGSVDQLAAAVRKAMDKVKQVRAAVPIPATHFPGPLIPEKSAINAALMDNILEVKGRSHAGMYKASMGRTAQVHGRTVGNQMGVNTWAAFAGTTDSAVVDGDFAMWESELQVVLKALRKAGISIVAIHNHLIQEEPRYVFLHYWGKGPAAILAQGLKAALDAQIAAGAGCGQVETIHFDSAAPGTLPAEWVSTMTGPGGAPRWEVLADSTAPSEPNLLAQLSSDATRGRFPLAILSNLECKDGEFSVKFKPVSGEVDQAAGLVWRYRDANHYYIVRANALEDNVVLYKVEDGKRTSLAPKGMPAGTYGVQRPVPSQTWSTLGVTFQGAVFTVYFNGQQVFEVEDATFTGSGKVGLWTKADSVTYFDDFRVIRK